MRIGDVHGNRRGTPVPRSLGNLWGDDADVLTEKLSKELRVITTRTKGILYADSLERMAKSAGR